MRYLYNVIQCLWEKRLFVFFSEWGWVPGHGPLERGEERVRGAWDELMLSFTVWWAQRARATVPVELE